MAVAVAVMVLCAVVFAGNAAKNVPWSAARRLGIDQQARDTARVALDTARHALEVARDSAVLDSLFPGIFMVSGAWLKSGDTVNVDTSQTWPHTALSDSTVNLPDSAFGTAADFARHYGQLRCGTTPVVTGTGAMVGGGASDTASGAYSVVAGGLGNKASGDSSFVGGGVRNKATGLWSTVGGGRYNTASGYYATVSGGNVNAASGYSATIGGGYNNTASNTSATVSGGCTNRASGEGAMVGGGESDTASGAYSAVAGGFGNKASGVYSAIPGGCNNSATDTSAFAFGYGAAAGKRLFVIHNTVAPMAVAIDTNGVRSDMELFVKGDAAISGAIMLGAAVIDSITYAADTSAMYIWTRGKKGTVTLTAP
jgi:hypothetical protein